MRYFFGSPDRVKNVARSLATALRNRGYAGFSRKKCIEIVARMYGHPDFASLQIAAAVNTPSLEDAAVGAIRVGRRRAQSIGVLTAVGVASDDAAAVIDEVQPTGAFVRVAAPCFAAFAAGQLKTIRDGFEPYLRERIDIRRVLSFKYDERKDELLGQSSYVGALFLDFECEDEELINWFTELHLQDRKPIELLGWVVAEILNTLHEDEQNGRLSGKARLRFCKSISGLTQRPAIEDADRRLFLKIAEQTSFGGVVSEMIPDRFDDAVNFVKGLVGDFIRLEQAGLTFADMAVGLSRLADTYRHSHIDIDYQEPADCGKLLAQIAQVPSMLGPGPLNLSVAEIVQRRAFEAMLERGKSRQLIQLMTNAGSCRNYMIEDQVIVRPDGSRWLVSDVFAVAHEKGLTVDDLVMSARCGAGLQAAILDLDEPEVFNQEAILRALSAVKVSGRIDADLVRASVAIGFASICPAHGPGIAGLKSLLKLARDGLTLADLAVCEWDFHAEDHAPAEISFEHMLSPSAARH